MNQPDHEVAARIVRHLDAGAERLDPGTLERLGAARRTALARYQERAEPVWGLAWVTSTVSGRGGSRPHAARYLVTAAALVLALIGFGYWQATTAPNDFSEVDVNLLTDELPINAYLDTGFDSWLKRGSR